jgi:uncharacterized protein (DUF1330 family)
MLLLRRTRLSEPEAFMETYRTIALSMFVGSIFGAGAIQCLHAQAKPPAYVIGQIEVTNQEAYKTEVAPLVLKALSAADPGFKVLARGGRTVSIDEPPASRVVLYAFTDMDHAVAAYNSPEYKAARSVAEKYADKFRFFAVEGVQ